MKRTTSIAVLTLVLLIALMIKFFSLPQVAELSLSSSDEAIERGNYLLNAGGCVSCHEGVEDSSSLSGGLALETEFGTFYVPNITPDVETGIGGWRSKDFLLALKHGRSPEGSFYFPAFPYPAYSGMTDEDALDIAAYLMSRPAVSFAVADHELKPWLFRWMMPGWNLLANEAPPALPEETDPEIVRGAYLARNLGHCGDCHTPRNSLGILQSNEEFAGAQLGEDKVEAIDAVALEEWTAEDFTYFLFLGMKPDGEFVGGEMEKVIEHNTSKLTEEDQQALAAFFKRTL